MTVLQELIKWTEDVNDSIFALQATEIERKMVVGFKEKLESFINKEKDQLVNSFKAGRLGGLIENGDDRPAEMIGIYMDPIDYYNKEVFELTRK